MQSKLSSYPESRIMFFDLVTWKQDIWSRVLPAWLPNHQHISGTCTRQETQNMETFKGDGRKSFFWLCSQSSNGRNYLGKHLWLPKQWRSGEKGGGTHTPTVTIKQHLLSVDRVQGSFPNVEAPPVPVVSLEKSCILGSSGLRWSSWLVETLLAKCAAPWQADKLWDASCSENRVSAWLWTQKHQLLSWSLVATLTISMLRILCVIGLVTMF